jgi:hypothetical protein
MAWGENETMLQYGMNGARMEKTIVADAGSGLQPRPRSKDSLGDSKIDNHHHYFYHMPRNGKGENPCVAMA